MSLEKDLEHIVETIVPVDPSFRSVDPLHLRRCIDHARHTAMTNCKEGFILAAMRLLALPGNGHTRLIPTAAISVLPVRFVALGHAVHLVGSSPKYAEITKGELRAVNGVPISELEAAADAYLAGTTQRKRVVSPILWAWPFALARLGVPSKDDKTEFQVQRVDGQIVDEVISNTQLVPASIVYPRNEHGHVDPDWTPDSYVQISRVSDRGFSISLPSFFDPSESALPAAIEQAADHVRSHPKSSFVLDVRGNTGGNFLFIMPLIDVLAENAKNRRVAVLVDKFTFSAAIVFVAILKHRLAGQLTIHGEVMGDGLTFFAEGGLVTLPGCGAEVRYSTAFHDWAHGRTDKTTPPEIANQIVPVGDLSIDREWVEDPGGARSGLASYRKILDDLN